MRQNLAILAVHTGTPRRYRDINTNHHGGEQPHERLLGKLLGNLLGKLLDSSTRD
jgi:hypothetical protein